MKYEIGDWVELLPGNDVPKSVATIFLVIRKNTKNSNGVIQISVPTFQGGEIKWWIDTRFVKKIKPKLGYKSFTWEV